MISQSSTKPWIVQPTRSAISPQNCPHKTRRPGFFFYSIAAIDDGSLPRRESVNFQAFVSRMILVDHVQPSWEERNNELWVAHANNSCRMSVSSVQGKEVSREHIASATKSYNLPLLVCSLIFWYITWDLTLTIVLVYFLKTIPFYISDPDRYSFFTAWDTAINLLEYSLMCLPFRSHSPLYMSLFQQLYLYHS